MSAHVHELVLDYLLGDLNELGRLELERHAEACADCRETVRGAAEGLAAVATMAQELEPSCTLKTRLLSSVLSARYRFAPFVDRLSALAELCQSSAEALLERIQDPAVWQDSPWPPLKFFAFRCDSKPEGGIVAFAKLPIGARFPMHRHLGEERYMIIQGRCEESDGRQSKAGDVIVQASGTEHAFVNTGDTELIFAVLVDGIELTESV